MFNKKRSELNDEEKKDLGEQTDFVQFHQSYDYTDFVEGLRPSINGDHKTDGFEPQNGIFKKFCINALNNLVESSKEDNQRSLDIFWSRKLEEYLDEVEDNQTLQAALKTSSTENVFTVSVDEDNDDTILIHVPENAKKTELKIKKQELLHCLTSGQEFKQVADIHRFLNRPHHRQRDSYSFVLMSEIKKFAKDEIPEKVEKVKRKDFVFIIDEINRGEMSKIFGELFFSIDPGYRGKDGAILTQYANMQKDQNEFDAALGEIKEFGHFFVPENVYIIGTMNDIDRSVESMDFAMRRRFAFEEITAEQSRKNMFGDGKSWKTGEKNADGSDETIDVSAHLQAIIDRMDNLNKAILDEEFHLGKDYQIGGAYFLKFANYFKGSNDDEAFEKLWDYHIKGVVREYLRGIDDASGILLKKLEDAYNLKASEQK